MDLQKLVDSMNEAGRDQRSGYHLTLGELIAALESADENDLVRIVSSDGKDEGDRHPLEPMSYRGYYSDLAFDETTTAQTVGVVLKAAREVLDKELMGYKGGDYLMDAKTPVWISEYGNCSQEAVIAAEKRDGEVALITRMIGD